MYCAHAYQGLSKLQEIGNIDEIVKILLKKNTGKQYITT